MCGNKQHCIPIFVAHFACSSSCKARVIGQPGNVGNNLQARVGSQLFAITDTVNYALKIYDKTDIRFSQDILKHIV